MDIYWREARKQIRNSKTLAVSLSRLSLVLKPFPCPSRSSPILGLMAHLLVSATTSIAVCRAREEVGLSFWMFLLWPEMGGFGVPKECLTKEALK